RQNSDVIALVQTGFIGAYGEWFYGNSEFGCGDHPKYGPRANVVWRLLEILPSNRMIALRTPYYKRAIKAEWEKSGKPQNQIRDFYARIGFHDDGFLADPTDINMFRDDTDRQQVKAETMTTPMVGETSGHSLAPDNHYPSWANAKAVAAAYHWSLVSATD